MIAAVGAICLVLLLFLEETFEKEMNELRMSFLVKEGTELIKFEK
jgi:hypothetical protein